MKNVVPNGRLTLLRRLKLPELLQNGGRLLPVPGTRGATALGGLGTGIWPTTAWSTWLLRVT